MSDAAGSNSVSCCNMPDSSSQDDKYHHHHHHHQPEPAAKLPEYSQQLIDGVDTRLPSVLLTGVSPTVPSRPPPKYEHPPPYAVDYTPGRGGVSDVMIDEASDSAVPRQPAHSYNCYICFACTVFCCCCCVFGAIAFILAESARKSKSTSQAKRLVRASFWLSFSGFIVGCCLAILVCYPPARFGVF